MLMSATLATANASAAAAPPAVPANPLLAPWGGPYGGAPPFDRADPSQLAPALEAGMAEQLAELDRIATNDAAPDFDNTIAALERSGRTLSRVQTVYAVYASTMNDERVQQVERDMEPKLAAFRDRITQNDALFRRIASVYATRTTSGLTAEQQRLTWLDYTNFVLAGAQLDAAGKARMSEINQRLAQLFTTFSQNLLAEENTPFLLLDSEADLAGLPASVRTGLAATAATRGHAGKWLVANTRSAVEPFLIYSTRRDLREKVWRTFVSRGDNGDAHDNKQVLAEILSLRAERARLLGFPTHAHWRLVNSMAKTPERALQLMEAVWKPAVARAREEITDMQALADAQVATGGPKLRIEPWDYRYYAEQVRKAKFDLDTNEIKPYLQLEKLREGMFHVAGRLLGLQFRALDAGRVPVIHPDVRVWEVLDAAGRHVGLWYFDPYARPGKQSGAWMNAYRDQERFDGAIATIVSNNANFVKGDAGKPVLISWDDATTLFHEFGHALHGLSSNVNYPTLAGTSVARDYVEFPSQLLEHWLSTPEILENYALHYQTGKPIPQELVAKITRARTFNQGFATVEYLSAALMDMKLHLAAEPGKLIDPAAFERDTLAQLGMPREIVMRHRTPQFAHVFSSDNYSAAYYSYLWADTLSADAWEAFTGAPGGPWDAAVAQRLHDEVFARGNTVDPAEQYRAFRGRDPGIDALMRGRGLPVPAAPAQPPVPVPAATRASGPG